MAINIFMAVNYTTNVATIIIVTLIIRRSVIYKSKVETIYFPFNLLETCADVNEPNADRCADKFAPLQRVFTSYSTHLCRVKITDSDWALGHVYFYVYNVPVQNVFLKYYVKYCR